MNQSVHFNFQAPRVGKGNEENTTNYLNVVLMLAHRLRRWPDIKTTLGHVNPCTAGLFVTNYHSFEAEIPV